MAEPPPRPSAGSALGWAYLGTVTRVAAQCGIGLALLRLVGPEPYGLVAAALIPVSLAGLVAQGGLAAAAIQRRDPEAGELAGAWWLQVGLGLFLGLGLVLTAPWIALALAQPKLAPVLRVVALGLPLNAASGMCTALLMRDLRSRPVQLAAVLSYLAGTGAVGLGLALRGAGVWAVALGQLAQALIQAALLLAAARPRLLRPRWPAGLAAFGAWTVLSNLSSWVLANAHQIIIARCFGALPLGLYNRFGLVTELPIFTFAGPAQQVLFPAVARADSPARRRELLAAAMVGIGLLFFPAMGFLALHAALVTAVLFGPAFAHRADMLTPMALAGLLTAMGALSGPAFSGLGRPRAEWGLQSAMVLLSVPALLAAVPGGIVALCWSLVALAGTRLLLGGVLLARTGLAPGRTQGLALARAALPAALGLLASRVPALLPGHRDGRLELALALLATGLGWAGTLALGWRRLAPPPLRRVAARLHSAGRPPAGQ